MAAEGRRSRRSSTATGSPGLGTRDVGQASEMEPPEPVRGRYRSPSYRRVSHGLMVLKLAADEAVERLRDLAAWRLVLPPDAVFTHVTAAELYGWWLPKLPAEVPVFAATTADNRPRRAGLICSRLGRVAEGITRQGLPVDAPGAVLLRAAWDLAVLDLVPMIDSALRLGDVSSPSWRSTPTPACQALAGYALRSRSVTAAPSRRGRPSCGSSTAWPTFPSSPR